MSAPRLFFGQAVSGLLVFSRSWDGDSFAVPNSMRIDRQPRSTAQRLEFFSLGGVLSIWWSPSFLELPWIAAAASLVLLSCWDVFKGAGRVDFILIGLAGYELVIGLTEENESHILSNRRLSEEVAESTGSSQRLPA